MLTGAQSYTALESCMQRSDHLEIELASHWLFFKIPGSYWLLFTGARFYTALDSCMQRSDHLEMELASHWLFFLRYQAPIGYCLQVPGSTLRWTVACNDLTIWRWNLPSKSANLFKRTVSRITKIEFKRTYKYEIVRKLGRPVLCSVMDYGIKYLINCW